MNWTASQPKDKSTSLHCQCQRCWTIAQQNAQPSQRIIDGRPPAPLTCVRLLQHHWEVALLHGLSLIVHRMCQQRSLVVVACILEVLRNACLRTRMLFVRDSGCCPRDSDNPRTPSQIPGVCHDPVGCRRVDQKSRSCSRTRADTTTKGPWRSEAVTSFRVIGEICVPIESPVQFMHRISYVNVSDAISAPAGPQVHHCARDELRGDGSTHAPPDDWKASPYPTSEERLTDGVPVVRRQSRRGEPLRGVAGSVNRVALV